MSKAAGRPQRTALSSGVVSPDAERYEFTLPSGIVASILKEHRGKHIELASRLADNAVPGSPRWTYGLVAVKTMIDGKPLLIEDIDEMWGDDVLALIGECLGKGGRPSSDATTSQSSESTPDTAPKS